MFTNLNIKSLSVKATPYRVFEKSTRSGFGVQISTKGTKTFFYYYKTNQNKQRFFKLGVFGVGQGKVTLKEAGALWDKWYKVRQSGHDPKIVRDNNIQAEEDKYEEQKRKEKELSKKGSYEQLLNAYVDNLRADNKKSVQNVIQAFNLNAFTVIKKTSKAKDVTLEQINDTLSIIEKRGSSVMSNRVRAYLSAAFSFGLRSDNSRTSSITKFGISHNPVRDVPKSEIKEKKGNRFLSEEEIKDLWFLLDETNICESIKAIIRLLICTGQRVTEVKRININDIDFKNGLWELEQTKAGRPHVVALPHLAIDIIKNLKPSKTGRLASSKKDEELSINAISQAIYRFCKSKQFEKFTPKDIRRTWKTLGGKAGISKADRDRYQNHALHDVSSEHYDRYDYLTEKRAVAKIWNSYLLKIIAV
jgi:integrase